MGEDTTPEIPIPMPEPPPPAAGLESFFPFGVVNHIVFSTLDFVIEGRFWPKESEGERGKPTHLYEFFPFGPPAQMVLVVVDLIWSLVYKG